jgi:uncharacterized protein
MALNSPIFKTILITVLFWAYPLSLPAVTPPIPAQPSQYVVDLAGVIDAGTRARLNDMLKDLEAKTTAQMVVLTLNSLEGEPLESFSHQTAVKWGIGQKGKDNGVLITVAVKEHKYRIEVGYGLEGPLPDSLVGSIGRQYLVPHFRKGDYAGGIAAAVGEIAKTISRGAVGGQAGEVPGGEPGGTAPQAETPGGQQNIPALLFTIIFVIVGLGVFAFVIPRLIKRASGGVWFSGGSSGGGGWSSSGGDSGGFSGGGGDFGGGGASGEW